MEKSTFDKLNSIDVSDYTEKKGKFTYLSWAHAVQALKKVAPDAEWQVKKFELIKDGGTYTLPYMLDPMTGHAFVEVTVTVNNVVLSQIHPVLNHLNKAIPTPNAFQINTAIQRALAKAISLHGLGLYLYRGEDLPTPDNDADSLEAHIEEVHSRPETLLTGKPPTKGHLTVEQNIKLDRLSRDPVFNSTSVYGDTRTFMHTNPTIKEADAAIIALQLKIKEKRKEKK